MGQGGMPPKFLVKNLFFLASSRFLDDAPKKSVILLKRFAQRFPARPNFALQTSRFDFWKRPRTNPFLQKKNLRRGSLYDQISHFRPVRPISGRGTEKIIFFADKNLRRGFQHDQILHFRPASSISGQGPEKASFCRKKLRNLCFGNGLRTSPHSAHSFWQNFLRHFIPSQGFSLVLVIAQPLDQAGS